MYSQYSQVYSQPELKKFAEHLQQLQELIAFYHRQLDQGKTPDKEPIMKLMNALIDLYD